MLKTTGVRADDEIMIRNIDTLGNVATSSTNAAAGF
jgi:hypothetical protein